MPIPRRIIQTQRSSAIDAHLRQSWKEYHLDYEYCFFDDDDCRVFIAERVPALLSTYDALPLTVQKADLFRYIAVYEMGGLYADVDTVCLASVHDYVDLSSENLHVCLEMQPSDWPNGTNDYDRHFCSPRQFLQWAFCAPSGHPMLRRLIERIQYLVKQYEPEELRRRSQTDMFTTLALTGPHIFSRMIEEHLSTESESARLTILPRHAWGAYPWEQSHPMFSPAIKMRHLFFGSWLPMPTTLKIPAVMQLKQRY